MKMLKTFGKLPLFVLLFSLIAWQLPAIADPSVNADTLAVATVNINTAGADEMAAALKGVGAKRAEAIVAYRQANGPFTAVEQLGAVKGIGEAVLAKNRHLIVLE